MLQLEIPEEKRIIDTYVISPSVQRVTCNKPSRNGKTELQTVSGIYESTLRIHP